MLPPYYVVRLSGDRHGLFPDIGNGFKGMSIAPSDAREK